MQIEPDIKLDYDDVLLRPKRSVLGSRKAVELRRTFRTKYNRHNYEIECVPIIAANMDGVGTFDMATSLRNHAMMTALTKHLPDDDIINHFNEPGHKLYSIYTMGISDDDMNKFRHVNSSTLVNLVCIDVANGYSERFINFVGDFRNEFPHKTIIAGNVATPDVTEELILRGADIVKVGIGPGSACSTRLVTGVGYPQLSAVMTCADAAHGLDAHVIADGGCNSPGDIAKAFAAGADFVMLGGMLSGTDQGGGEIIEKTFSTNELNDDGSHKTVTRKHVAFYGMSSEKANKKHFGGMKDYRAAEGREILVEYKGDVDNIVQTILGGLRSACTYVGAKRLKDLPKCATFVRCTSTHNRIFEKNHGQV